MTNPLNPNFNPGVGRLVTDRYDFAAHVDGSSFNHTAGQIVLSPSVVIGLETVSDVQTAISLLSGTIVIPSVPNATTTSLGIIQLGGDLMGLNTSAVSPKIGYLQGTALSISAPSTNQVLQWNGSAWVNAAIVPATTSSLGTIQLSTGPTGSTGDIGNTATVPRVIGLQGNPVSSAAPSTGNVLVFSAGSWGPGSASGSPNATTSTPGLVQLAGDFDGYGTTATVPRTSGINGATVPAAGALTTGNVLQVSGSSALSYGFIANANVATAAAIQGTKITPSFGTQNLSTTGTAALGATTITGALVAGAATAVNTLTGSFTVTTRTVTSSFAVDTTQTDYIIFVNTSSAVSITLPVPTNGRILIFKDISGLAGSNNISILQHSSEKIEGVSATKTLATNWGSWTFTSNGTDWFMI
jgi:hypothetical protein